MAAEPRDVAAARAALRTALEQQLRRTTYDATTQQLTPRSLLLHATAASVTAPAELA